MPKVMMIKCMFRNPKFKMSMQIHSLNSQDYPKNLEIMEKYNKLPKHELVW